MSKKKTAKFSKNTDISPIRSMLYGCIAGVSACIAVFIGTLFAASAFALNNPDPSSLYSVLGLGISILSAFVGGVVCSRLAKNSGIFASAICGLFLSVTAFLIGIFAFNGSRQALSSFVFLLFPLVCTLGGLLGKPKKSKKKNFSVR